MCTTMSDFSNSSLDTLDCLLKTPLLDSQAVSLLPELDSLNSLSLLDDDKCVLQTDDGQLLYLSYSVDPSQAPFDPSSVVLYLHDVLVVPPEDESLSSFDNLSPESSADDLLKVEERVKVFDAFLTPAEKKSRPKPPVEPEEDGNYDCDLCGATFSRPAQYYGHLHRHTGEYTWECHECPEGRRRFTSQSQLRKHEKKHHVNSRPHTCAQCGSTFDRPSQLDYHKRRVHDGERSHVCQLCGKAFFKRSDLRTHLNIHLSVHGCMCEICGRRFSHVSNLSRHMRTHSGVKPYPCSVCGRRFNQINSLNGHKLSHNPEQKVYSCCGKKFKTQILFRKHVKLFHESEEDLILTQMIGKQRQFHCKVCGESFPFVTLLRTHEKLHDQFSCLNCKKNMENLEDLKSHSCKVTNIAADSILADEDRALDEYLWLQAQQAQSGELEVDCVLEVDSLSCDGLDVSEALSCSEVDKLVRETCCQVGADDSQSVDSLEIESLISPALTAQSLLRPSLDPLSIAYIDPTMLLSNEDSTVDLPNIDLADQLTPAGLDDIDPCSMLSDTDNLLCNSGAEIADRSEELNTPVPTILDCFIKEEPHHDFEPTVEQTAMIDPNIDLNIDPSSKHYVCMECGKTFRKASNFKQHQGIHDIGRQLYRCKTCGRTFAWKSTLNKHSLIHSDPSQILPSFPCKFCNKKSYSSAPLLQAHINRDHLKQRPHGCDVCNKRFFKKYDLKIHLRTHTQERPYKCNTCGRGFGHVSHLIRHERKHTGERPYQCAKCPANFIQSNCLTAHLKHHAHLDALEERKGTTPKHYFTYKGNKIA